MSTHIQDDKFALFIKHINDGVYELLGCTKTVTDCWSTWLVSQGYSGDFDDMMVQFLIDYGYTGHADDMLKKWWEEGAPGLSITATTTADTTLITADTITVTADVY